MKKSSTLYKRILVKLSGEALMGQLDYGIDPSVIKRIASELIQVKNLGVEVAVVIGGGNIFRGAGLAGAGMARVTGDYMGMLATVMNALAIQDALESMGSEARVMSAIKIHEVCEDYIRRRAVRHLEKDRFIILAAGTGNPFFTTDSAAVLRAIEISADVILKGTRVDGIYDEDPEKNLNAVKFDSLSFDEVLKKGLKIMDTTAFTLSQENNLPIIVFVTAYNQHALQAFEHQAFDYVLKPIDSERFVKLVERLRLRLNEKSFYANRVQLEQVVNSVKKSTSLISVPTDEGVFQVQLGDILYLQAVGDFVAITLSDKALITRSTTNAMVEKLASDRFIQIHRSYFVNLDAIEKFEKTRFGDGLLHMSNQQILKVSRKYKNTLLAELNN